MNKGKITELLQAKGMEYDETSDSWYGTISGLAMRLVHNNDRKNYDIVVSVTNGSLPDKQSMNEIASRETTVARTTVKQYNVSFTVKKPFTDGAFLENIGAAISALPALLKNAGWNNCCEVSGRNDNLVFCMVGGEVMLLCDEEYGKAELTIKNRSYSKREKGENIVTGIVGALLGSFIGVIAIVLIGQLGYVSVLAGLIMGVCTVKGYALLGGKLSKKGALISVIIMFAMTYVAAILDACVYVIRQSPEDVAYLSEMVEYFAKTMFSESHYIIEFVKLLAFTLIGAIPAMAGVFRGDKLSVMAYKLKEVRQDDGYGF